MSAALFALSAALVAICALALALRQARLRGVAEERALNDERDAQAMRDVQEIMAQPLPSRRSVLERMRARSATDAAALPEGGCQSGGGAGADR